MEERWGQVQEENSERVLVVLYLWDREAEDFPPQIWPLPKSLEMPLACPPHCMTLNSSASWTFVGSSQIKGTQTLGMRMLRPPHPSRQYMVIIMGCRILLCCGCFLIS